MNIKQVGSKKKSKFTEAAERYIKYLYHVKDEVFDPNKVADETISSLTPKQKDFFLKELITADLAIMNKKFISSGLFSPKVPKKFMRIGPNLKSIIDYCEHNFESDSYWIPIEMCDFSTGKINHAHLEDIRQRQKRGMN